MGTLYVYVGMCMSNGYSIADKTASFAQTHLRWVKHTSVNLSMDPDELKGC